MKIAKTITLMLIIVWTGKTAKAQTKSYEVLFYMQGNHRSIESFKKHANMISIICPAAYSIDKQGTIKGKINTEILKIAKKYHVKVMPLFGTFDQQAMHQFLYDAEAKARTIRMMLNKVRNHHFYGWQMDIEHIKKSDGPAYVDFFQQAADSLHKYGYKLSIAVPPYDRAVPRKGASGYIQFMYKNWYGWAAPHFKELAEAADFLSVMTYDQSNPNTPPGPVAGIPWVKKRIKYLLQLGINPNKISMGIPSYSDFWYPASNKNSVYTTRKEIPYKKVKELIKKHHAQVGWMNDQGVNYARWTNPDGVFDWIFVENVRSFKRKWKLVPKYHLRGISVWVLGSEDPKIWDFLNKVELVH